MEKNTSKDSDEGLVIAVALNGGSKSKYVMKWALEKFLPEENVSFKIIHVYPKITGVPTPMGNLIPISRVREDLVATYRKEIQWQKMGALVPYQRFCNSRKVKTDIVLVESDEITKTITTEVAKCGIKHLVLGSSSNGLFSRKVKGQLLSSLISESSPDFCTVYIVSKGKLECLRPSKSDSIEGFSDDTSTISDSTDHSSRFSSSTFDPGSSCSVSPYASPLPSLTMKTPLSIKPSFTKATKEATELSSWRYLDFRDTEESLEHAAGYIGSFTCHDSSYRSFMGESSASVSSDQESSVYSPSIGFSDTDSGKWVLSDEKSTPTSYTSNGKLTISLELERIRMELERIRGMYAIVQDEMVDATQKMISDKEEYDKDLASLDKVTADVKKKSECERERIIEDSLQNRDPRKAKEEEKFKHYHGVRSYQKFSWEEIVSGSSNFSDDLKIGTGSYGTVYKCKLHHAIVAIKVLHSKEGLRSKKFQQEFEIMSRIRHPHLLLLLGAFPKEGCLVYEYMENGNLEDRLLSKKKTSPLTWYDRFRIAWEVASAIAFLHSTKPKPTGHLDIKPSNILLDQNLGSKIGDAGLCAMLNVDPYTSRTSAPTAAAVSNIHPPEHQRTGMTASTKSDVYALGVVILQLLTAKPAVGIANVIQAAIDQGRLMQFLDQHAGKWPSRETTELARLALQCVELSRRERPDLKWKILPSLEKIKEVAEEARDIAINGIPVPPAHFICPILKDVMDDPYVAADGYTYDRKAIEMWIKENDTSPTTNFPLSNKNLIPNHTIHYAIMEWKSKVRSQSKASLKPKS